MKILILGSGAREHALAACLDREDGVRVALAPGNAGIARSLECLRLKSLKSDEISELVKQEGFDLVVIGPEALLVAGLADQLRDEKITVFGPSKAAAALEGSKSFSKEIMRAVQIPTADGRIFTEAQALRDALKTGRPPFVVKADGLAAGKGVAVTADRKAALSHALKSLESGPVILEEYLSGREVSLFFLSDGQKLAPLTPARDYKRLRDGDTGPNTGGMGAHSPVPDIEEDFIDRIQTQIAQPVIEEMARRNRPFSGLLYCGLMLTSDGIRVVEFNVRFGDPETQVILARLTSNLSGLLMACASPGSQRLSRPTFCPEAAVGVVLAGADYPGPGLDQPIFGLNQLVDEPVQVLFGACREPYPGEPSLLHSSGGRVLNLVARAPDFKTARKRVYKALSQLTLPGGQWRTDIALDAQKLENQ